MSEENQNTNPPEQTPPAPPLTWGEFLRRAPRFLLAVPEAVAEALSPARLGPLLGYARPNAQRPVIALMGIALVVLAGRLFADPMHERAAWLVGAALVLWLSEAIPAFATALMLFAAVPLVLGPLDSAYTLNRVLDWAGDPVLVLFFGGFALGAVAQRHGMDATLARQLVSWSRGQQFRLVALLMIGTAVLGMWMSNTAAAAMMFAASRPVFGALPLDSPLRRALLVGIAVAANLSGLSTPVGSPPNGIALAQVAQLPGGHSITFVQWLAFGLPLVVLLLAAMLVVIRLRYGLKGKQEFVLPEARPLSPEAHASLLVFALVVIAWLTEPLHGLSTPLVALIAAAVLFGSGLLTRADVTRIDWATLVLVGGSITLGRIVQETGLLTLMSSRVDLTDVSPAGRTAVLVLLAASVSAFLSNTATATLLVPLAATFDPSPATTVLVAIGSSLGMPFIVSTPPNAMAFGEGGLRPSDMLLPGLLLMFVAGIVVALTGPWVLGLVGVR